MTSLVSSLWLALSLLCLGMAIRHAPDSPAKRQWYLVSYETLTADGTLTGDCNIWVTPPLTGQSIRDIRSYLEEALTKDGTVLLPGRHVIIRNLIPLDK